MTKTLLRLDSSARYEGSVSRALADQVVEKLGAESVVTRDLNDTLPHLDTTWVGATFTPPDNRSEDQTRALALSDTLIAEVQAADTLLISMPVYNFALPASLKAWIDQIARVGVTFNYTETGPVGLLEGKRAIVVLASGGTEVGGPADFATPYLKFILGFMGITDVQIVAADSVGIDAEASKAKAQAEIEALVA